ncbi:hypothetical protein ABEG75_23765 [Pantoea agglomerans]|uniref:hypothetical protein n=1 Tax=Enterobacter agglomerans TaxID=549 RepID=UPI00165444E0|nr:hypothetical protein [Pantoea agglomerans]
MTETGNFSPASARPGDYDAQTRQAIAVMQKLQARLTEEGEAIRPAVTAVAGMMCGWWESGISGTDDPREAGDRVRLRVLAAALSS